MNTLLLNDFYRLVSAYQQDLNATFKKSVLMRYIILFSIIICFNNNTYSQQKVVPPPETERSTTTTESIKYFARFEIGAAYGKTSVGSAVEVEGFTLPVELQIGAGIIDNTFIHALVGANVITNPTFVNTEIEAPYTICMWNFGGGLTYYVIPEMIYASVSVIGSTNVRYLDSWDSTIDSDAINSQLGVGVELKAGANVLIGGFLPVGMTAFYYTSSMNDMEDEFGNTPKIKNNVLGITVTIGLANL